MNNSHQETSLDIQEAEFGGPDVSKQRRVIHFSSGETLEEDDSAEEEEQPSNRPPFKEAAERARLSFKNVAILVGRISLLTCDFLGERLAGALGLNAAKYQYAIDQHHRDHKTTSSQAKDDLREGQVETIRLSPGLDGSHYGATGDVRCPADSRESCDEKHMDRNEGCHNRGYQADEDYLE
ncbi:protein FAM177A1 isoform X2 [Morone saxatilis]|uniref:protein FAM177A1 isoform X2 n=1 Tax=Morone saxatilis TaxID=34816 RepID=UPI0015E1DB0F|nr:protein FAM177A1 isoform X2 [Morone saxatilis]